ncbi:hypothetical protein QR680_005423 [Steinernema hermaphroditum]|uniref:Uncharacterized protein n=1 Tax=Steinernema hermaphroditum TaxID=289476 RepID=A0AA39HU78_9BILA|nr:hypothetical protein QR680_005423 [Steinernema hermaphroditum]
MRLRLRAVISLIRMIRFALLMLSILGVESARPHAETAGALNRKCRDLLTCAIKKNCIGWLSERFENATITAQLYNDLDQGIDYGCVFTSGCLDECNRCPLCDSSKKQLVDVLSGNKREDGECSVLVNCATECVASAGSNVTQINRCLRHDCAFHCFDGSCPKCSAFVTRVFNQVCASANLRNRVVDFQGQCYQMFRAIVFAKFESDFKKAGLTPSIGPKTSALRVV